MRCHGEFLRCHNFDCAYLNVQVEAVDSDSGVNSRVEYRIISGDPRKQFSVNRTHGHLSVAAALDREMVKIK